MCFPPSEHLPRQFMEKKIVWHFVYDKKVYLWNCTFQKWNMMYLERKYFERIYRGASVSNFLIPNNFVWWYITKLWNICRHILTYWHRTLTSVSPSPTLAFALVSQFLFKTNSFDVILWFFENNLPENWIKLPMIVVRMS